MSVIKNDFDSDSSGMPFSSFVKEEAERMAQEILEEAKEKAERIVRSAHEKKEEIKEAAREEGYDEGYRSGLVEGKKEGMEDGRDEAEETVREEMQDQVSDLSSSLRELLSSLEETYQTCETEARQDLLELTMKIAEAIVKTTARIDPDVIRENVYRAVELCASRHHPTIYLHPDSASAIESFVPDLKKTFHELETIELKTDSDLEPGGCRVTTETGEVDAGIETQLEQIRNELLRSGSPEEHNDPQNG